MLKGKFVFSAGNFGSYDIYSYDLQSKQQKQLTSDSHWNDYPRFSPDGRQIAFGSARDGGKQEIWVMNADGSAAKSLTPGLKWADFPTWSPDGKEIAFISNEYFQVDIFALNLETSKLRRLTQNPGFDCYPDWSPDGKSIAFASERGMHQDLYLLDLETMQEKKITSQPGPDTAPAFHPDGKRIAFVSHRQDQKEGFSFMRSCRDFFSGQPELDIWSVELATGEVRQLTANRGVDRNVRWSPDGTQFVYTSCGTGSGKAELMFCEYATGKTTPLRIDQAMEKGTLERPYLEDLKEHVTVNSPWFPDQKESLDHKLGQKMLAMAGTGTLGKGVQELYDAMLVPAEKWEGHWMFPVTFRYVDWK